MIPASYLFRDIYDQRWGEPAGLRPAEPPLPRQRHRKGYAARIYRLIATAWVRRTPPAPRCETVQ